MNELDRILGLAGLATSHSVATPADRELKEYDEEGCPCNGGSRCTCPGDCPDCNCHGNNEWDESVEEAANRYVDIMGDDLPNGIDYDFNNLPKVNWSQYSKEDIAKFVDHLENLEFDDYEGHYGSMYRNAINWIEKNILKLSEGKGKPDFRDVDGDGDTEESWKDAEEDKEEMDESTVCESCNESPCSCDDELNESPTMDTTQLVIMMRNAGLSEEVISQKLDEWANTPEGVGEVEPTAHGDAYDFAQSVNLSLKRYLDAQDMKVQVTEHKVENMKALYAAHKAKK